MKESKLYFLFESLEDKDLRQFSKFVRSPFHNKHEDVIRLFDYLKKGKSWKKEDIFKYVFPQIKYDIRKLHYVNSYLIKVLESFFAWQEWQNDGISSELHLLKAYGNRRLDSSFKDRFKKLDHRLKKEKKKNEAYYKSYYQLYVEDFSYHKESGRGIEFNLQKLSDTLDISFIANKLKHTCTILSHQTMLKKTYDLGLTNIIIETVSLNKKYLDIPGIAIYYYAYLSIQDNENENVFNQLLKLINSSIFQFDKNEQRDIYILAINYCIRKMNSGKDKYGIIVFDLYKAGLENNVFIKNGILSRWTYNNIIGAGLKLKEFDWVERFIYDYKYNLDVEKKEDNFNFNLAKLFFEKRDYDKAMPLLVQIKYDDLLHNLRAKLMLAKMYYELNEINTLENLLDSLNVFISRKKEIGYHKENYQNIILIFKKIIKINHYNKKEVKHLKDEITSINILTERKWFLQKINEF